MLGALDVQPAGIIPHNILTSGKTNKAFVGDDDFTRLKAGNSDQGKPP